MVWLVWYVKREWKSASPFIRFQLGGFFTFDRFLFRGSNNLLWALKVGKINITPTQSATHGHQGQGTVLRHGTYYWRPCCPGRRRSVYIRQSKEERQTTERCFSHNNYHNSTSISCLSLVKDHIGGAQRDQPSWLGVQQETREDQEKQPARQDDGFQRRRSGGTNTRMGSTFDGRQSHDSQAIKILHSLPRYNNGACSSFACRIIGLIILTWLMTLDPYHSIPL